MSDSSIAGVIKGIISQVAGIDPSLLADDLMVREELMLDSLKEIEIAARVEKYYAVSLDEKKIMKIKTLHDFIMLVEKTVGKK